MAGEWQVLLLWTRDSETYTAWAKPQTYEEYEQLANLVAAVNRIKQTWSGRAGGAFRINEYGQVIVPTSDGGLAGAQCVGAARGAITFGDNGRGEEFDLSAGVRSPGAAWDQPAVGLRYTIHVDGRVSFEHQPDQLTRARIYLSRPPLQLVGAARSIRGEQASALVVNDQLVALVRRPPDWDAFFVGTIDLSRWFPKEDCP